MVELPGAANIAAAAPSFLVVDDDPAIRSVCARLLRFKRYHVHEVDDGVKALQVLASQHVDVVLTDLNMPMLDGLELLRQIKARYPHVDVLMITAFASIDTAKQALKLGAFDYLTKPLDLEDLERSVQSCLESRELKRLRQERETLSEMVSLMELSHTISAKLELDDRVRDFMNQLSARFHPSTIALSLLDPSDQTLMLLAQRGIPQASVRARSVEVPRVFDDDSIVRAHAELVQPHPVDTQHLHVLRVQERPVGVLHMSWVFDTTPLDHRAIQLLEVFTASMAVALDNSRLYDKLKRQNWQTITALVTAIDARDPYTRGHSEQVTSYAVGMAYILGLPDDFVERLRYSALLHDVGKIGIPDAILLKPSRLTAAETARMEQHAMIGAQIVEQVLADVAPIIRHHHEAYDGSGYPDRLRGEEIPLEARIIAVADAFDAMTTDRAYRKGISTAEAIAVLQAGRDKQWQGDLIDVLVTYLEREDRLPLPEAALVGQIPSWDRSAEPRD